MKRPECKACGTCPEGCSQCPQVMTTYHMQPRAMKPGGSVKFAAHGTTGLVYRMLAREGDDCDLADDRGRVLRRVPVELLELVR